MFCNKCGKNNPINSKFCKNCGFKFEASSLVKKVNKPIMHSSTAGHFSQKTEPYPYVISLWKLFILSVVTFGLYDVYWFYRQWKSFYAVKNQKHGWLYIFFVSFFAGISSFSLFKIIANEVKNVDQNRSLRATGLSILFIIINVLYKLPSPYWLLSSLSVLALLPVQNTINYYWRKKYGERLTGSGFGVGNFIVAFIGIIFFILALFGTLISNNTGLYKASYRISFIQGCKQTAGPGASYCGCLADYMINNYNQEQLQQISTEYQTTKQIPQSLKDGVNYCLSGKNPNNSSAL